MSEMKNIKYRIKSVKNRDRSSITELARAERRHVLDLSDKSIDKRIKQINKEFKQAFKLLQKHQNTVTFFGAVRVDEDSRYYNLARILAEKIVDETGAAIVTGGGPGIMEAANRGAADEHGNSIGMTIQLPHEQVTNKYVNRSIDFYYFFSRKVALSFAARAYVYFPGGFGTMDEFFEILTLKQTGRIKPLPIILIGTDFWNPLDSFIRMQLLDNFGTIAAEDVDLYHITDDLDEAIRLIKAYSN
jgi:uncharacterized protein (TIGR00730 family)